VSSLCSIGFFFFENLCNLFIYLCELFFFFITTLCVCVCLSLCLSLWLSLSLCVPLFVSLSLLVLIYGVEEASSGLNNAHRFTLELLISSSFLSVFLHQELSKADSRRLSGLHHHSVSFLQPAGC
jgi:hypothetical protein